MSGDGRTIEYGRTEKGLGVPLKNMKLVSYLITNEKYHYVELNHKEYIQDKLWETGSDMLKLYE